jgi:hypothetical protein
VTSIIIAAAVLGIIVLRRFNRIAGSVLAMLIAAGIGVWGFIIYGEGGGLAFAGWELPRTVFLGIIVVWIGLEGLSLWQTLRRRKRPAAEEAEAAPTEEEPPADR